MDPVAHTLVGAALAETGLKKLSRYATPTLVIGANLPDIDGIANLWGRDASLYFRRGWTHGILSALVLPLLLFAAVWLWHRWRGHRAVNAPPLHLGMILLLSCIAVWSHPLLDWLNTYGVRLLMPFDDRWFYGDTLFIVDPWVWLLAAAGVVLAHSKTYPAIAGWIMLATLATGLILSTELVSLPVKLVWIAGVAMIFFLRWHTPSPEAGLLIARTSFVSLLLYTCMAYGLARLAESNAASEFAAPLEAQANPIPGAPSSHRVVLVYDDFYRVVQADGEVLELAREDPNEIVRHAMEDESIRGFMNWVRYPYWDVEETADSWIVRFRDLRYVDPGAESIAIGTARVEIPK